MKIQFIQPALPKGNASKSTKPSFEGWRVSPSTILSADAKEFDRIVKCFHDSPETVLREITHDSFGRSFGDRAYTRLTEGIRQLKEKMDKWLADGSEQAMKKYNEVKDMAKNRDDFYYTPYKDGIEDDLINFVISM